MDALKSSVASHYEKNKYFLPLVIINRNGPLFKWSNCYKNFILPVMLFWRYIKRHGNKISEWVLGHSPLCPVNLDRVV
jgi:hypothetical protein